MNLRDAGKGQCLGLPGEDVFAGVWVGCCSKLGDDHSVLCHGTNVCIRPDEPDRREYYVY